jgi:hypothetical protein
VRVEGLGKIEKKFNDLIGNQTRDLPACSIDVNISEHIKKPRLVLCEKSYFII